MAKTKKQNPKKGRLNQKKPGKRDPKAKLGKPASLAPKRKKTLASDEKRAEANRRSAQEATLSIQDVFGSKFSAAILAGPKDPARREKAIGSFRVFCETYGRKAFFLNWAPYHLKAIDRIEEAVRLGSSFAYAMPRGSGKSSLGHWAILWSVLSALSPYGIYVGATVKSAERRLQNLKKTLRFNDLLFEDFPEVCGPIRHVGGEPRKATGQKWKGETTGIEWSDKIVFADIPVSWAISRNSVIDCASIDGEIRGRLYERQDGTSIRPSFAVVDDPQTRESAKSVGLTNYREEIIKGDVKYLSGPGSKLGIILPVTVIYQDDLADRLLDRKRNPEFKGERSKMLESFPERADLWEQYGEIRKQSLRDGGNGEPATEFYESNREEMDRGAVATWPERFNEGDVSAIESAMKLKLEDEASFFAEAQNEPIVSREDELAALKPVDIEKRELSISWGVVPDEAEKVTGFIDVQEKALFWGLVAWGRNGTGTLFRYSAFPEQGLNYFTLSAIRRTISAKWKGLSFKAALFEALGALVDELVGIEIKTETGGILPLSAIGIDSGWGEYAVDVYRFCLRSRFRSILRPTKGVGITATKRPLVDPERKIKSRESVEGQWLFSKTKVGVQLLQYDTNLWKSRVDQALRIELNGEGALTLTKPRAGGTHRMIAEHLTAERSERVTANGRTVTQWAGIPGRDNHFLDVVVGSAVLANTVGVRFDLGFSLRGRKAEVPSEKNKEKPAEVKKQKPKVPRARSEVVF